MAAIANAQRAVFNQYPSRFRRHRFFAPAALVATSAAKLVDVPGLRQSARAVREIAVALEPNVFQAPKHINAQTQEQIDRIDRTIWSILPVTEQIGREVHDDTDVRAGYLVEAQVFIDKLEKLRAKLAEVKYCGYKRKLLYQGGIIHSLDECDRLFLEASREFAVIGVSQAHQVASQSPKYRTNVSALPAGVVKLRLNFQLQNTGSILISLSVRGDSPRLRAVPDVHIPNLLYDI